MQTAHRPPRVPTPGASAAPPSFLREHARYDRMLGSVEAAMLDVAELQAGSSAIDVGCGAGTTTLAAAARVGPSGTALGVDLAPSAVEFAAERARRGGVAQARFLCADAARHDFRGAAADAVVSRFGTLHFDDRVGAYRNLRSALAPGGRLAFVAFAEPGQNPWATLPGAAVRRALPGVPVPAREQAGPFALADRSLIASILGAAGYARVSIEALEHPLCFGQDLQDALEFYFETDGRALAARLTRDEVARAVDALRDALVPYLGPAGVSMPAKVWLVRALNPG